MTSDSGGQNSSLGDAVINAAWWSMLAQVASKLISPITTIVLARLLTPDAFGVVALSAMVTSLSSMFSDAGFQRYLIQCAFHDKEEEGQYASTAFWTNMGVSCAIVLLITLFQNSLAEFVGCPGLGTMLAISSLSLPLTALVSVQTALYQKRLDFKTLFGSRFGSSLLIFLVAVPMAYLGCGFWSLVVSTLASNVFLAVWLTTLSAWKPRLFYDTTMLKKMLSFGVWILLESFATWLNTWLGTFIISQLLTETYIGYYNTSVNMATSITGVVTTAILPVAFSTFAKLKRDRDRFERVFFVMQRYLAMCMIPIAAGCLVFRDLVTTILLGDQWLDTSLFFGCWMLAGCTVVVFGNLCSEAYRALGMPRYCVLVQVVYLVPFVPTLCIGASWGWEVFSVLVPVGRISLCLIHLVVARVAIGISPIRMISNPKWTYLQTILAMVPGIVVTSLNLSFLIQLGTVIVTVFVYAALVFVAKDTRGYAIGLFNRLHKKVC